MFKIKNGLKSTLYEKALQSCRDNTTTVTMVTCKRRNLKLLREE